MKITLNEKNPAHSENLGCVSINLSMQSIGDDVFLSFLINAFESYQIPPDKICFEITETMAISNLDNTFSFIKRMKNCAVALLWTILEPAFLPTRI